MAKQYQSEQTVRRHTSLVLALLSLLRTHTLQEISVKDICQTADIPRRTFYHYFENKEDVLTSIIDNLVQQSFLESLLDLLLNIDDQPTYFMSLKDAAGLVKMYALVNVQQYQIVAVGNSISECVTSYEAQLANNGIVEEPVGGDMPEITGRVEDIRSAVINGNTCYYIKLEGLDFYFSVWASEIPEAALIDVGDTLTVTYEEEGGFFAPVEKITFDPFAYFAF